jgi:hypothetical protein
MKSFSLLEQVVKASPGFDVLPDGSIKNAVTLSNNAISILHGVAPKDQIEGLLAAQMVAVHNASMMTMQRAMVEGQPSWRL